MKSHNGYQYCHYHWKEQSTHTAKPGTPFYHDHTEPYIGWLDKIIFDDDDKMLADTLKDIDDERGTAARKLIATIHD